MTIPNTKRDKYIHIGQGLSLRKTFVIKIYAWVAVFQLCFFRARKFWRVYHDQRQRFANAYDGVHAVCTA